MADIDQETTDADVAAAEDAAREAEKLALSLEQQVATGDDSVTSAQLEAQRTEARFAVLRIAGVKAKLAAVREAKRLAGLAALRSEIDTYVADAGTRLAAALQELLDAREQFLAATADHDDTVTGWAQRASELGAPEVGPALITAAFPSEIARGRMGIESLVVGARRLRRIDGEQFLDHVLAHIPERDVFLQHLRAVDGDEAA